MSLIIGDYAAGFLGLSTGQNWDIPAFDVRFRILTSLIFLVGSLTGHAPHFAGDEVVGWTGLATWTGEPRQRRVQFALSSTSKLFFSRTSPP